jgi:hypothetical protein
MPARRAPLLLILVLTPLLMAASDPAGDLSPCRASAPGPGDPPDLVGGTGRVVEEGTSARWDLRFADPLVVPDREGRPFRVDILIRDPTVPAMDVAYYRDLNRIVRYDAVQQQGVVILLLPERAQNVFLGGTVDGDTLTIQIPGRQITRDLDLEGVPIQDLRWTAVVRDEHRCDVLGSTRPHLPMVGPGVVAGPASPIPSPTSPPPAVTTPGGGWRWAGWIAVIAVLVVLAYAAWRVVGGLGFRGSRKRPDPS